MLADLKVGDEVALLTWHPGGWALFKIEKITKRTKKFIYLRPPNQEFMFNLDGNCVSSSEVWMIRVPTKADLSAEERRKGIQAQQAEQQKHREAIRKLPEFTAARHIGYLLTDAVIGEDEYLAFAKRIGMKRLNQMTKWVEDALQ
jgi:hypothetical protein